MIPRETRVDALVCLCGNFIPVWSDIFISTCVQCVLIFHVAVQGLFCTGWEWVACASGTCLVLMKPNDHHHRVGGAAEDQESESGWERSRKDLSRS